MKKIIFLLSSLLLLTSVSIKAQDIGQIISGSTADANKYLSKYLEPFGKAEILNMGRGWTNTARVHKFLGLDITVGAELAIVPPEKQVFVFNNSDYSTFTLTSGASSANVQTFLGDKTSQGLSVSTTVQGHNVSYNFNTPSGIGEDMKKFLPNPVVPLPVAQIGIGLFKHTELKLRYFPKTNFGNNGNGTQVGVFGAAIQHEFTNYLPFLGKAPILHISALAGYNSVNVVYGIPNSTVAGANQRTELNITAMTFQAIASLKLLMLEIYYSPGYITGKSDASLKGSYTINYKDQGTGATFSNTVVDPVSLNYTNSGVSNTFGVRLNLFFLKVFADYTFAQYNTAGAGVALSIR